MGDAYEFVARCFGCRHTWNARVEDLGPGELVPWLQCPKCGEFHGAEVPGSLGNLGLVRKLPKQKRRKGGPDR
jgi:ssDNA-binding Zn-finger/Zn-ribbon topoisomerase 1